jgi:Uma2 family endonuclease
VGRVFYAPFDVVFTNFDVVEPDLLYMSNERAAEILTSKHVTGAPEIVIEIGSHSTRQRDETVKLRLYERSGVSEYWVVDPELGRIRAYRSAEGQFRRAEELLAEGADVLTTRHLPGLELPLTAVFAC